MAAEQSVTEIVLGAILNPGLILVILAVISIRIWYWSARARATIARATNPYHSPR